MVFEIVCFFLHNVHFALVHGRNQPGSWPGQSSQRVVAVDCVSTPVGVRGIVRRGGSLVISKHGVIAGVGPCWFCVCHGWSMQGCRVPVAGSGAIRHGEDM